MTIPIRTDIIISSERYPSQRKLGTNAKFKEKKNEEAEGKKEI